MKRIKSTLSVLLAALLVCLLPAPAQATGPLDPDKTTDLTLSFQYSGSPVAGVPCDLYKIADRTNYSQFNPLSPYGELYLEKLDGVEITAEIWQGFANTLKAYVTDPANSITPTASGTTDSEGKLTFSALNDGLYLVVGRDYSRYSSSPFLVALPGIDEESNSWQYAVTANMKTSYTPKSKPNNPTPDTPPDSETFTRKVLKIWEDESDALRPASIQVRLLHNGEVYDTVQLTAENNWKYTWEGLPDDEGWDLEELMDEALTENYLPLTSWEGITCTVTNFATTEFIDEDPPLDSGPPTENPPDDDTVIIDIPDDPTPLDAISSPPNATTTTTATTTNNERLPQTGLLWWPVPVLACAGVLCVVIGVVRRRGDDGE